MPTDTVRIASLGPNDERQGAVGDQIVEFGGTLEPGRTEDVQRACVEA